MSPRKLHEPRWQIRVGLRGEGPILLYMDRGVLHIVGQTAVGDMKIVSERVARKTR